MYGMDRWIACLIDTLFHQSKGEIVNTVDENFINLHMCVQRN